MAENDLLGAGLPHALDHRIVVERIRQDEAVRHHPSDGGNAGLVGDVTRTENERSLLAVQIGELVLKPDQRMRGAGDVAGAPSAGPHPGCRLDHGANDFRMLSHAEVIVGTPDHDFLRALGRMPDRMREASGNALEIGKYPVAPLVVQSPERVSEKFTVIHSAPCETVAALAAAGSFLEWFQPDCRDGSGRKIVAPASNLLASDTPPYYTLSGISAPTKGRTWPPKFPVGAPTAI